MFEEKKKKLVIVTNDNTKMYGELLSALVSSLDDKKSEDGSINIVGVKDGSVEAVIWDEATYKDNFNHLSSSQKLLFIGQNESTKPIEANINFESSFSKYGVYFGYLGNKAILYSDKKILTNKDELYGEFIEKYSQFIYGVDENFGIQNSVGKATTVDELASKAKDRISAQLYSLANKGVDELNKGAKAIKDAIDKLPKKDDGNALITVNSEELIPEFSKDAANKIAKALQVVSPVDIAKKISIGIVKNQKEVFDQQYRCAVVVFYIEHLAKFME